MAIICVVTVLIVAGGLTIWGCDAWKRKKIRETALQQSLVMDDEEDDDEEDEEEEKDDINRGLEDRARRSEEDLPVGNEDVELEEA